MYDDLYVEVNVAKCMMLGLPKQHHRNIKRHRSFDYNVGGNTFKMRFFLALTYYTIYL